MALSLKYTWSRDRSFSLTNWFFWSALSSLMTLLSLLGKLAHKMLLSAPVPRIGDFGLRGWDSGLIFNHVVFFLSIEAK